jgi:acyl-CoA synthetase (AMP-forming)/AMP-acid ligase II
MIATHPATAGCDMSSLDRISYGGSPMPEAVYRRCLAAFGCPLLQAYGVTEVSGVVCHQLRTDPPAADGIRTAGQPALHVDLRIVGDDGTDVRSGEIGEIAIAGPRVMAGYWERPDLTAAAIRNGWYHTGDLGRCDATGNLTVAGRKKDMIITGGENVYPAEVEDVLTAHPDVAEAAVFGVPDPRWGEEVRAVVVPRGGRAPEEADLIALCRSRLGGYKVPKRIEVSPEPLPKSGPGKIAKNLVRARYGKEQAR